MKHDWQSAFDLVRPHVVQIQTSYGSGTGFLAAVSRNAEVLGFATAAHVVAHAHEWEQPIRIWHPASGKTVVLHPAERAIFLDWKLDTAAITCSAKVLPLPANSHPLAPEGKHLKIGNEIGWVGFPAVAPSDLCFFSGQVCCWQQAESRYLVDGVAINGVSGGPAFVPEESGVVRFAGVVSAYIANRATRETLPGLSVIRDVAQLHGLVKALKSLDEAKTKEREGIAQRKDLPPDAAGAAATGA